MIRTLAILFWIGCLASCANSQQTTSPRLVGGPCEGCEAVWEYGNSNLTSTDTLPDFQQEGISIKVEGTIYQQDGKTPAPDVVLYVYHTNQQGIYAPKKDATGWGKKHGYNRSWLRTDEKGHYSFFTIKPAPYPSRSEPAHIHYIVMEPNGKYYWLSSCHFQGDSLLTQSETQPDSPRGGSSGLLSLKKEGDLLVGTRDVILGKHIPGYE